MNDSLDPILQQEEQRKLRTQLMWRLAFAVILVGGVLGALAWLDQGKEPQMTVTTPHDAHIASSIASEAASAVASAPETASAAEASFPEASAAASEILPASFVAGEPTALPASLPVASAPLPAPRKTEPLPAKPAAPTSKPGIPTIAVPAAPAKPAEPIRPRAPLKTSEAPAKTPPSPLPAPDKLAQQPAAVAHYPAPVATSNGYTVQAGVFLHAANAERMLRTVQSAGIPAYLETRVQIGPFSSKAEAETAVKKLRQLGVEPIIKGN